MITKLLLKIFTKKNVKKWENLGWTVLYDEKRKGLIGIYNIHTVVILKWS